MQAQRWICAVKQATQTNTNPHIVIDDHDWISNGAALVRQDYQESRSSLELLQAGFRQRETTDPACDRLGIGGEDFMRNAYFREIKRWCLLCTISFSPVVSRILVVDDFVDREPAPAEHRSTPLQPCPTSVIEIHIRAKSVQDDDPIPLL